MFEQTFQLSQKHADDKDSSRTGARIIRSVKKFPTIIATDLRVISATLKIREV